MSETLKSSWRRAYQGFQISFEETDWFEKTLFLIISIGTMIFKRYNILSRITEIVNLFTSKRG